MKLKKGKWMALTVAVLMGMSAFTSVSADEGQTNTTFIKGELNGIPGITFSNDFAKYHVWDSAKMHMYLQKIVLLRQMKGYLPKRNPLKLWPRG